MKKIKEKIKQFFLKIHRFWGIIFWSLIGIAFALAMNKFAGDCIKNFLGRDNKIYATLFLIVLSASAYFCIWRWRNKDRLAQLNFNNFSNALQLFVQKENKEANAIGLKLLVALKQKGVYQEQIDLATPYKYLQGVNLKGANLKNANLRGSDLRNADLRGANLEGANLEGADLEDANLRGANLEGANLRGANLRNAILVGANLRVANLEDANLEGAEIENTNFDKAKFMVRDATTWNNDIKD